MMAMMKEFMKSGGKALREPVGEDFVTGECVEWLGPYALQKTALSFEPERQSANTRKGKFGWIKPDIPVEHDAAKWRGAAESELLRGSHLGRLQGILCCATRREFSAGAMT